MSRFFGKFTYRSVTVGQVFTSPFPILAKVHDGKITYFQFMEDTYASSSSFRQAAHALRHTFASHFIQNGGNILTLQKILGHSSLAMTMRYAHLAPDHLQDAVRLGPAFS